MGRPIHQKSGPIRGYSHRRSTGWFVAAAFLMAAVFAGLAAADEASAVFKSNAGGRSWIRSDTGIPRRPRLNAFGSADRMLLAGTDSGIFTSADEARTWQPATGAAMSSGRVISFAALGRRVFSGTDGKGVLVSQDGGASWVSERGFHSDKVRCLLAHDGRVYAGTDADGVFASGEAGQPWTRLSAGLPVGAQAFSLRLLWGHCSRDSIAGAFTLGEALRNVPGRKADR